MLYNTILIVGTYENIGNKVRYSVRVYCHTKTQPLTFVNSYENLEINGYSELWPIVKTKCANYFDDHSLYDGLYTGFMDDLSPKCN